MLSILIPISIALLSLDVMTSWLSPVRAGLSLLLLPVNVLADAPSRLTRFVGDAVTSRATLFTQRDELRAKVERLNLELQRLAALESENQRLRRLLESKQRLALHVRAAEIIGTVPGPSVRQVLIDKGSRDGTFVGQPVVDADGLVGQIIEVTPFTSRVLEVTDVNHAVPAEVVRSGLRVVAVGTGSSDRLEVRHITASANIARGDLLITSGLDQRFPPGYPVAKVLSVSRVNSGPFMDVVAVPMARLDVVSHVLLVYAPSTH